MAVDEKDGGDDGVVSVAVAVALGVDDGSSAMMVLVT